MDTPDKPAQPSPSSFLNKFEDSPVFNYISTLSPIKPFNLGHSTQPFQLLSFSSPQALQTPPTGLPREAKNTRANLVTDLSKSNYLRNGSEVKNAETSVAVEPADLHPEEVNKLDREVTGHETCESLKVASEVPRPMKYKNDATDNNTVRSDTVKPHRETKMAGTELFPVRAMQDNPEEANCSYQNEIGVQSIHMEQNKEGCEWEKYVCGGSDILDCHSPTKDNYHNEPDDRSVDSGMLSFVSAVLQPPNEHNIDPQRVDSACPVKSENHDMEGLINKPGDIESFNERSQRSSGNSQTVLAEEVVHYVKSEVDDKSCSQQQQTTRRRCLVYEMSGSHYRKLLADSTGNSPTKPSSSFKTSNDKSLMFSRPVSNKFSSALPGIGLHLNALAAASKDKIIVKRQTLTCRRQLINLPSTKSSDSLVSDAKPLNTQTAPAIVKRESDDQNDGGQVPGHMPENSLFGEGIEFPPDSPKKKRRKSESVGELDSCKRCNCKRSKCLKLYCECFAAGLYCVEPCNCQNCFNKPAHEQTVLETRQQIESRNPLAFAPKVIRCSDTPKSGEELNKTPASARHKRGCNCKKSGCLKKYCECFQGGVGCSLSCRCEGCKNTFGQKEGTESFIYHEPRYRQMTASDASSHDDEENYDQATTDSSNNARQPVRRPFHFGGMEPHLPALSSGCFLQSCTSQNIDESDQTTFEEEFTIGIPEDDSPEALKGEYLLPTTCVKSASPNCKRISPPHCDFETSPGWRSCRKLILRSIPPLPALDKEKGSMELP